MAEEIVHLSAELEKLELAKKCLELISDVAGRAARSNDSETIGYALQELTQVLYERTGSEEIRFFPIAAERIAGLDRLREELDLVAAESESFAPMRNTGSSTSP